jgi:vacuolar-type H+-ATPase subunit C/Vma6
MRAIDQLAAAGDVASIGAMLLAWRHPFGALVATEATRQRPDLLHLEMALVRSFAESARGASHDRALRAFVRTIIDVENAWAAQALAAQRADVTPAELFVHGGALVTAADLAEASATRTCSALVAKIHAQAPNSAPDLALAPPVGVSAEDAVSDAMIRAARVEARREPLGLAPVILLVLRTRAELQTLHRIVWSIALGVPVGAIAARIRDAA